MVRKKQRPRITANVGSPLRHADDTPIRADRSGLPPSVAPDGRGELEERLIQLLGMANTWLQFAETKNAALSAFCVGIIAAILSLLGSSFVLSPEARIVLLLAVLLLGVSCCLALSSFLPELNVNGASSRQRQRDRPAVLSRFGPVAGYAIRRKEQLAPSELDNLFFFDHLAKYTPEQLTSALRTLYGGPVPKAQSGCRIDLDLAGQVVANSRIAARKFRRFKQAFWFTFLAVALAVALGAVDLGLHMWSMLIPR